MIRSVFAATLAVALFAGPVMALAQTTDMVTYADTLRKKSGPHSAIRPVTRGPAGGKHAAAVKHAAVAKRTASAHAAKGRHRK